MTMLRTVLPRLGVVVTWLLVTLFVVMLPSMGLGPFEMRQVVLVAIMALIVSGVNLSFGYAGELALGQAAIYAAGAYVTAYVTVNYVNDALVTLLLSAVVALGIGLITGIPGLRLGGWLLAVASFFLVLMVKPVLNIIGDPVGGYEGFTGIPYPVVLGTELDARGHFVLTVLVTSVWFAAFRNLVTSLHGNALRVLKTSTILAESLGISRFRLKLKAYALGAVPAGMAGTLTAYLDGYIAPQSFGLDFAISVLAAAILGGATSVYGAFFGAAIIVLVPLHLTAFREYAFLAYGVMLILGGVFLRSGLVGIVRYGWRRAGVGRRLHRASGTAAAEDATPSSVEVEPIAGEPLVVRDVSKRFGGNQALDGVSFRAEPGQVTALIGPNGSGKTTLLNMVSGFYAVDDGTISIGDRDVTALGPAAVSRAGVGRTFQTPLVPEDMTVRDVVITGLYTERGHSMPAAVLRTPGYERARRRNQERADRVMAGLELLDHADKQASSLALGTRRMLELARVLAGAKSVVLLDEVASGLDEHEVAELAQAVRRLRAAGATVVLVEHNFSLVQQVADQVVVLADGRLIATGRPAEVAADEQVMALYLGEGAHISGTRARDLEAGGVEA
jgi:branched-chain amino acid transport system permease protein